MSNENQEQPSVKVVDKRRFSDTGEERRPEEMEDVESPMETAAEVPAEAAPESSDPRDERLAAQAARIDELSRAYAALIEDNKAFRARMEREKTRVIDAERASVAQALLEAVDELDRGLAAALGHESAETTALTDGIRLTRDLLNKRITDLGAERMNLTHTRFDPRYAEAVDTIPIADAAQDEMVLQEIRAGYKLGDRILRPARVRVGRLARA
jgi:molecular chaperone GrpE